MGFAEQAVVIPDQGKEKDQLLGEEQVVKASNYSRRVVPRSVMLWFAVGIVVERMLDTVFTTLSMTFYNQVHKLRGSYAGAAVAIALIVDAFADPLIGSVSDRFRGVRGCGRRHPFLYAASLPVAACLLLFFSPPDSSEIGVFMWMTCWTVALRVLNSTYALPHLALGAELTGNAVERTLLMSIQAVFAYVISPFLMFAGLRWMFSDLGPNNKYGHGLLNPHNYPPFIWLVAGVVAACGLLSALGTHRYIPLLRGEEKRKSAPHAGKVPSGLGLLLYDLRSASQNRNFRFVALGYLGISFQLGVAETLSSTVSVYFWRIKTADLSLFSLGWPVAGILIPPLVFLAARKFERRTLIVAASLGYAVLGAGPFLLVLTGVLKLEDVEDLLPFLLLAYVFGASCMVVHNICVMSMLGDITDEHELNTSERQEGAFYAARTFFGKCSSGLGHMYGGFGLDVIGFDSTRYTPTTLPVEVVHRLGGMTALGSIGGLFAAVMYLFYAIDKRRHQEILKHIDHRIAEAAQDESKVHVAGTVPQVTADL
eukprot:TRINITY_DN8874_c0_g1_i1.p2 TRINITY_DN8874_c0_g1~~TRINITY_DN8874_c0_g1_i1.p2  ORF type:complete len:539 (-),score=80.47 TRINITY_DN8874_c0_g1_i1:3863-5479(-)